MSPEVVSHCDIPGALDTSRIMTCVCTGGLHESHFKLCSDDRINSWLSWLFLIFFFTCADNKGTFSSAIVHVSSRFLGLACLHCNSGGGGGGGGSIF